MTSPAHEAEHIPMSVAKIKASLMRAFDSIGERNGHSYVGDNPIAQRLHKLFCIREARSHFNAAYDAALEDVIAVADVDTDCDEGTTNTLCSAEEYSLILTRQKGSETIDSKQLVNELKKSIGKEITSDFIDSLCKKAMKKRSGSKRFDVAIGGD